jgi:hypothetical protein
VIKRPLEKSILVFDDADDEEAVDDDGPQWMDEVLHINGEDDFGPVEDDADLTAPELRDILADVRRPEKGKGREVEVQLLAETDDSDDNSDSNDPWTWHE